MLVDFTIGLTVATLHFFFAHIINNVIDPLYEDANTYHNLAARLAQSFTYGPPQAYRPPGWPIALALPYRLFGAHPLVGIGFNAALAGLTVVILISLAQRLGLSQIQARASAIAYGLFPWMLVVGSTLYAETFFTLLTVFLCWLVVKFRQRPPIPWWWIATGGVAAYASLVRPVMVLWLPIGVLFALGRNLSWRSAIATIVGALLIFSPWTLRNYERLHAFVPLSTSGSTTIWMSNNDLAGAALTDGKDLPVVAGDEVTADRERKRLAIEWIKRNPGEVALRVPQRIVRTLDPVTLGNKGVIGSATQRWAARILWIAVLVLVALGMFKAHRGYWLVPLSFVFSLVLLPLILSGGTFRFLLPVIPFLALWWTQGFAEIYKRMPRRGLRRSSEPAVSLDRPA